MEHDHDGTAFSRRNFLRLTSTSGFTVAALVATSGMLGSPEAEAQTRAQEAKRKAAAKYTMTIATAYRLGTTRQFPVMQVVLKHNIENATQGRVYVKLVPGGVLGAGSALAQKVQAGTIQAGQHSVANFAPYVEAVDVINIPYWCSLNQQFINLVTSDIWKKTIDAKVEQSGFRVLLYQCVAPRTMSMRRGLRDKPFRTPADLKGVKFRVPGSQILGQFYTMLGANPTPIAWGETASALKQGVADALDPNVMGLDIFGFKDIVSYVTFAHSVQDAGVYSCNLAWLRSLDKKTRDGVERGAYITFLQNMSQAPASREYAMTDMASAGVKFYTPTDDEIEQFKAKGGAERKEWDSFKKKLVGSIDAFEKLREAANTKSKYFAGLA